MKKIGKYAFSLLPFLMIMAIMLVLPSAISIFLTLAAFFRYGSAGYQTAYSLYMDHINLISMLIYLCALIPAALWYYFKLYKKSSPLRDNCVFRPSSPALLLLLAFAVSHLVSLLMVLLAVLLPDSMAYYTSLVEDSGMTSYSVVWFISTVLLPPLTEELVFRGLILRYLRRAGARFWAANLIQALLFGCFHMNLIQGIYAFLLGLILGYLANHYRTLTACMLFHGFFNLFGTLLTDIESRFLDNYLQLLLILLCIPLTILAFGLIHRQQPRRTRPTGLLQDPYLPREDSFI